MSKYYGDKLIKSEKKEKDSMILTLDDKTIEGISLKMYKYAISKKKIDPSALRELRIQPVVKEVLKLLLEWDIKVTEFDYLMSLITTSLNENMKTANDRLWGNETINRKLSDVDKVLQRIEVK